MVNGGSCVVRVSGLADALLAALPLPLALCLGQRVDVAALLAALQLPLDPGLEDRRVDRRSDRRSPERIDRREGEGPCEQDGRDDRADRCEGIAWGPAGLPDRPGLPVSLVRSYFCRRMGPANSASSIGPAGEERNSATDWIYDGIESRDRPAESRGVYASADSAALSWEREVMSSAR